MPTFLFVKSCKWVSILVRVLHLRLIVLRFAHQVYFYAELAFAASKSNNRDKANEYIDLAIQIANSCYLQTMDFSIYKEFLVVRWYNTRLKMMCAKPRFFADFRVEPQYIVAHREEV
jgi:hypothetical protein